MLLLGSVLVYLFLQLHSVLQKDFAEVPQRLQDGSMVNLNSDRLDQRIKYLLEKEFYFEDPRDIQLAYSVVAQGMGAVDGGMDNIGELNKQRFSISTQDALDKGGISFRKRAILARTLIGFSGDDSLRYDQEKKIPAHTAFKCFSWHGATCYQGPCSGCGGHGAERNAGAPATDHARQPC